MGGSWSGKTKANGQAKGRGRSTVAHLQGWRLGMGMGTVAPGGEWLFSNEQGVGVDWHMGQGRQTPVPGSQTHPAGPFPPHWGWGDTEATPTLGAVGSH